MGFNKQRTRTFFYKLKSLLSVYTWKLPMKIVSYSTYWLTSVLQLFWLVQAIQLSCHSTTSPWWWLFYQSKHSICQITCIFHSLNPIQDGEREEKRPPISFSLVTFRNVGISHQNFLTFSFHPFPHWCRISSLYLVPVPIYWTWTKTTLQKMPILYRFNYDIWSVVIYILLKKPPEAPLSNKF